MTLSEENYLKAIFHIFNEQEQEVNTNAIAEVMKTKASSVTDMLKKLAEKGLINYVKYQGVTLTDEGQKKGSRYCAKASFVGGFFSRKITFFMG